jgi:glycosyltransferase involved in cell wall biosynthesis
MNNCQLLIIGRLPPPIGGVTIHIQRLCNVLKKKAVPFLFSELSISNLFSIVYNILLVSVVHYHACNPYGLLFFGMYSRLLKKKFLFTYHGNIGGEIGLRKKALNLCIRIASVPIVLNQESFNTAYNLNKNTQLFAAFIFPEIDTLLLDNATGERISDFCRRYRLVFATNASTVVFDSVDREIYGISQLVRIFSGMPEKGLIISDPSGTYKKYLMEIFDSFPENILILDYQHDFVPIIRHSSVLIRATTTDGDSLSIKEALFLKKWVIASDCIARPDGVLLYKTNDCNDLIRAIESIKQNTEPPIRAEIVDSSIQLISLYHKFFSSDKVTKKQP